MCFYKTEDTLLPPFGGLKFRVPCYYYSLRSDWQPCTLSLTDGNHGGVETYICPSSQTLNVGVPCIVGSPDRSLRYGIVK